MGIVRKLLFSRLALRWLFRGGPAMVFAKLLGVGAYGAWRWRRDQRDEDRRRRAREIPADYEVVEPGVVRRMEGTRHEDEG